MIFIIITSVTFTFQSSQVCPHPWDVPPKRRKNKTKTASPICEHGQTRSGGPAALAPRGPTAGERAAHHADSSCGEFYQEGERGERKGVQNGLWGEKDREGEREERERERKWAGCRLLKRGAQHLCTKTMQKAKALPAYWSCTQGWHTLPGLRGAGQVCLNDNIGTFSSFEGEKLGVAGEGK